MYKQRLNNRFLKEFEQYNFSKIKEEKIFLVGSITIAKDLFIKIESILQLKYKKMFSICSVDGLLNKNDFSEEEWNILQEIALKKLNEQEAILVLNINDYIGKQSKEEINYFNNILKRPIYYLSELKN